MDRHTAWRYSTTFEAAAPAPRRARVDLGSEGLDTVATVSLNGTVLGFNGQGPPRHRFDVRGVLVNGDKRA